MYLLTDDPKTALDCWEKYGMKVYIFSTAENGDFVDSTFERVANIEEFIDLVRQDFELWNLRPDLRGNIQEEIEDALHTEEETTGVTSRNLSGSNAGRTELSHNNDDPTIYYRDGRN